MTKIEKIVQTAMLSVIDWVHTPFARFVPLGFFRYGVAGASNMLFDWILYFVFYHFVCHESVVELGFVAFTPHIASFVFKFPITFLSGFWLNRHISFSGSRLRRRTQLIRYLLVVCCCILINYVCLKFFVEFCGIWPSFANVLTTIIATIFSYFTQKYFSFRR